MMKKLILLTILLMLAIPIKAQYQVNCLSSTGETMTFRVVGYGKNAKKASLEAETSVVKAIMFHGIPDTQQTVPIVSQTETQLMKDHSAFLKEFFSGTYQNVITRSVIVRKFGKDINKQKSITLDVTVNIRALRTELERNGLIRKFGL